MSERSMRPLFSFSAAVLAVLGALAAFQRPCVVAAEDEQTGPPGIQTPEEIQQIIDKIRQVILPQQKELARELIRQYPDSDLAKRAQKILDEYKLYDDLAAAQRRRDDTRTTQIRDYWDARRPVFHMAESNPVQITNLTDQLVLYQAKGPSMGWTGPLQLPAGESHRYNYPVVVRRTTRKGLERYSLAEGNRYVFRRPASGDSPQLFTKAK